MSGGLRWVWGDPITSWWCMVEAHKHDSWLYAKVGASMSYLEVELKAGCKHPPTVSDNIMVLSFRSGDRHIAILSSANQPTWIDILKDRWVSSLHELSWRTQDGCILASANILWRGKRMSNVASWVGLGAYILDYLFIPKPKVAFYLHAKWKWCMT